MKTKWFFLVALLLLATVLVLACGWHAGGDCYSQYEGCQADAHQIRAASTAAAAAATATAEAREGTNADHQ